MSSSPAGKIYTYSEISKSSSDLFSRDFAAAGIRVDAKTKASNGLVFNVIGSRDAKTEGVNGELRCRYTDKPRGISLVESWTSANKIAAELELADTLTKGLKLTLNGSMMPHLSANRNAKFAMEYRRNIFALRSSIDMNSLSISSNASSPTGATCTDTATVGADVAVTHNGITLGGELVCGSRAGGGSGSGSSSSSSSSSSCNSGSGVTMKRYGLALGYRGPDYDMSITAGPRFRTLTAAYFHRVASDTEVGGRVAYRADAGPKDGPVNLEMAVKRSIDKETFIKAKIDTLGRIAVAYSLPLREGVRLLIGASGDAAKISDANAVKFGLALSFDA